MAARGNALYEEDFYAWTRDQAAALRRLAAERWNGPLDVKHLAEEIEDVGREQRFAVESQLRRIIEHLLKLEHSPSMQPRRQWRISVRQARDEANKRMTGAIRRSMGARLQSIYDGGRHDAMLALADHDEREAAQGLPDRCPYRLNQLLDCDWLPTNRHSLIDELP